MPELPEPTSPHSGRRPRRLPATGLPAAREGRRTSSAISVGLHLLIIFLIAAPAATHTGVVVERLQGAGGLGPAGGGASQCSTPWWCGYRPVTIEVIEGHVQGAALIALSNRAPRAARPSTVRVFTKRAP